MINYAYQNLFYKSHQTKDILIVDDGATVTPVSGEAPTVTGATTEIHTEDIESESFRLDECLCSEDNLRFGLCESAKVEFRIKNKADIPNLKSSEYGDSLNIYLYFNGDSDTLFQIGQYECDKDDYTNNRKLRDVVLYDALYSLNNLDITPWYNNYFDTYPKSSVFRQIVWVIADLFNWIQGNAPYDGTDEVSKASPQIPVELDSEYTLCNGAFAINKTIKSDIVTFNFFMEGLLEFNGSFGHITREGKFKIITMEWYSADPVREVTDDFRIPPTNYDDVATWGIGQIKVYDQNNSEKFTVRNTTKKYPSTYVFVDPWILADRESGDSTVQEALERLQRVICHLNYTPNETQCSGDLCVEVGDRINIVFGNPAPEDTKSRLRSYVLERHFSGFGSMKDTYTAKGNKKQPEYKPDNNNWHVGDSTTATSGSGTGGVAEVIDEIDQKIVEIMRNYGLRVLDEPSVTLVYNKSSQQVEIIWTDPNDLSDYRPVPIDWAGTIIVRKEGERPITRWNGNADGNVLVDSTTRDEYSETAFIDDDIEQNKRYYYAIMPYHIALDDADHPIKYYRWTKVFSVDTARFLTAPTLANFVADGTTAQAGGLLPTLDSGSYAHIIFGVKKGSIPASVEDSDYTVEVEEPQTVIKIIGATFSGLDENSTYYCVIFIEDSTGLTASSVPLDCITGEEIVPSYMQEVGTYNFDSDENKHNFKTCAKYQNGSYLGGNWGWDFSMYSAEGMMATANGLQTCLYEDGATVSIDTSNGINVTYTGFTIKSQAYFWGTGRSHVGLTWESGGAPTGTYFCGGSSETYYPTRNDFETLDEAFEWIYKSFRRINLIVDGVTYVEIHD